MFKTFNQVCYEIAMLSLPRVTFSEVPGIQGVVLKEDAVGNVLVHWGRMDRRTVVTNHLREELTFL